MKARFLIVYLAVMLVGALCGACAPAEGQAVSGEANGYTVVREANGCVVSLEIPGAWKDMAEEGEALSDGALVIGKWGVSVGDDLTMMVMSSIDIWQGISSEYREAFGFGSRGDCETGPETFIGIMLQSQFVKETGVDVSFEEHGGVWYLKYVSVYETTMSDGSVITADQIYFTCVHDGIQYNIVFYYPDFDARAEAEVVAILDSIVYSMGTEYTFDLFSIVIPDDLVVFTDETVNDESLYTGLFQGYQESMRSVLEPDWGYYLVAYEPEIAYSFRIFVTPIGNWYDLNAASADQIENEILPPYVSEYEGDGKTVCNSGFCRLGDQTYLSFSRLTFGDDEIVYDIRYVTMVQVKGYLYSVAITAVSHDAGVPDGAAEALIEAIRSMTYFGTEGTRVTNIDDGYAMTVQVPINWVNMGELDTDRDPDDNSAHWGVVEDGVRSMVTFDADPYWSEMTSAQRSEEGFLTKYDCEMIPGTEPGDGYLNAFKGGGNDTEYMEFGGVWYVRHDIAAEGVPGQVMPCISLFMTIHEGTYFTLTFIYDAFTPECEAEMNKIMESVTYRELE